MAIIGTVYKSETMDGFTVHNVPYGKHNYPCHEGCCENMLSIGAGAAYKVSWLLHEYMPQNNIQEIDFNDFDWTDFKF